MEKLIYCVDGIAILGDKFVLIERLTEPYGLAFPGGKIDPGESATTAILREFPEETGLDLVLEGCLGAFADPKRDPRGNYVSTVFYGVARGTPRAEVGKTRVLLLTRADIKERDADFVVDHSDVFAAYEQRVKQ